MTSQTLFNLSPLDNAMKSKHRRASMYFRPNRGKQDFNKGKVCFAENLATIHEVDNYAIYNKPNFHFKLPEIDVHKYRPLVCRDPYAKPSKRKRDKYMDMFVSDSVKLPFIKLKTTDNDVKKGNTSKSKEVSESLNEPRAHFPKTSTRTSDKLQAGNTLQFRYSDFILRKMDGSASSKDKIFVVK